MGAKDALGAICSHTDGEQKSKSKRGARCRRQYALTPTVTQLCSRVGGLASKATPEETAVEQPADADVPVHQTIWKASLASSLYTDVLVHLNFSISLSCLS